MKLQIPLWLLFCAAIFGVAWIVVGQFNTSRITSDASLTPHGLPMPPNPSGIFVPPNTFVFTEFRTSTVPLVVEITITSNIIKRDVFYLNGHANTNDQMLTNWVISKITNSIP